MPQNSSYSAFFRCGPLRHTAACTVLGSLQRISPTLIVVCKTCDARLVRAGTAAVEVDLVRAFACVVASVAGLPGADALLTAASEVVRRRSAAS